MKKIILLAFALLFYSSICFSAPSTTLSITPAAVDATTITASDENTRNNAITTWANAHDHTDIGVTKIRDTDGNTQIQTEETSNENIIRMDTNGTERWIMTAAGERTMPTQPAFQVYNNAAQSNLLADGSTVTVVLDTEVFDQSSDFATNTFTAPVSGRYVLGFKISYTSIDSAATGYNFQIVTSNRTYSRHLDPRQFAADIAGRWAVTMFVLADMDSSDTATVGITQDGGTQQSDIANNADAFFFGYLAI